MKMQVRDELHRELLTQQPAKIPGRATDRLGDIFVGFKNYATILQDEKFLTASWHTVVLAGALFPTMAVKGTTSGADG